MKCPVEIALNQNDLNLCIKFAQDSAKTQQEIEFGQKTTNPRSEDEIARDNLIGKIAEVAFKYIIEEHYPEAGKIALDFNIYERGQYDAHDTIINNQTIDIKATRQGGEWFLIEWNKLNFRAREGTLPHYFVFFTVGWNRGTDTPTGTACLEGFIPIEWLSKEHVELENRILVLRKNKDKIPGKEIILQADNYAIHKNHIGKMANRYMSKILQAKVPDKIAFQLP